MLTEGSCPMENVRGFTLVELLVTVTVLGVLLGVGMPNLFNLIEQNRLTTDANNLVVSLNYARSEAIRRNSLVSVCPSADGNDCNSDSWTDGGIVFTPDGRLAVVGGIANGGTVLLFESDDDWRSASLVGTWNTGTVSTSAATTAAIRDGNVFVIFAHLFDTTRLDYEIAQAVFTGL